LPSTPRWRWSIIPLGRSLGQRSKRQPLARNEIRFWPRDGKITPLI
jgi:hypothetical protein